MDRVYNRSELVGMMNPRMGHKAIYRLRWQFLYHDGKVKTGIWNGATNRFSDTAAFLDKKGLLVARIQTEDFHGYGIRSVFECDGHDYVSSRWIGASSVGFGNAIAATKPVTINPDIIGITFQLRDKSVSVFVDGSISQRENRRNERIDNVREHKIGGWNADNRHND